MFIAKENLLLFVQGNDMDALLAFNPDGSPCVVSELWEIPTGTHLKRAVHSSFKGACSCGSGDHVVSHTSEYDKEKSLVQVGVYINEILEIGNGNPDELDTVRVTNQEDTDHFFTLKRIKEEAEKFSRNPVDALLSLLRGKGDIN